MQLMDFGAIMNSAQAGMPDYAADQARKELMGLQKQQLAMQVQKAQQQIAKEKSFQTDLEQVLINPTDDSLARLIMKHPDFAQEIKSAHGVLDESRRRDDLRQMGEIYSAARNGKFDLAATSLERRIEADKAADGTADPIDEALLAALKSGDPVQQKAAMGQIGLTLSAITGPEKFASTLGALNEGSADFTLVPGARRYAPDGTLIAEAPFAPRPLTVGEGQTVYEYQPGGGDPASSGGARGFQAIDSGFVAPQEGGYAASDGASGAPVNYGINQRANPDIDVKSLTPEQAAGIRYERYWVPSGAEQLSGPIQSIHYDTAINMGVGAANDILKQSKGDPAKYMDIREARHRKMSGPQEVWGRRNAELRQFAGIGGGASPSSPRVIAKGNPKPKDPVKPSETRVVNGQVFVKVNGQWYRKTS